MKPLLLALGSLLLAPVLFIGGLLVATTSGTSGTLTPTPATAVALAQIPPSMLDVYAFSAEDCPGLPWQLVAAIGSTTDPSLSTQLDATTGEVHPAHFGPLLDEENGEPQISDPGQPGGWARTLGPFEILSTIWARYGTATPDTARSTPDAQNAWDSTFTLTRVLCTYLERDNGDTAAALSDYDPSPSWGQSVSALALSYGMAAGTGTDGPGGAGGAAPPIPANGTTYPGQVQVVVAAAESQLGVPYVWGGETSGRGFDCSGLIQWAYAQAGITLPRVTYAQADVGTEVARPWPSNVSAGDLLIMPGDDDAVTTPLGHVAMAIGGGLMIQAPYTGTFVQIDPIPWSDVELVRRVIS